MKFWERVPKPQANLHAENKLGAAQRDLDISMRKRDYSEARLAEAMPLIREEVQLTIKLENAELKLEEARAVYTHEANKASHQLELKRLQRERHEIQSTLARLKGEPPPTRTTEDPETFSAHSDSQLHEAERNYEMVKGKLDHVRIAIAQKDIELQRRFGLW